MRPIIIARGIARFSMARKGCTLSAITVKQFRFSSSLSRENLIESVAATDKDLIETAVKELLQEGINSSKPITDDHIQQSYKNFQHRLKEARLCITDCEEFRSDGQILQEETKQATEAVDEVFACYIDMLDTIRECPEQQKERFGALREKTAIEIKSLREQLKGILNDSS